MEALQALFHEVLPDSHLHQASHFLSMVAHGVQPAQALSQVHLDVHGAEFFAHQLSQCFFWRSQGANVPS